MGITKYLILAFILCVGQVNGQTKVYIFKDRYKAEINSTLQSPDWNFEDIKILLGYMMDPKNTGNVDYKLLDSYIEKLFPNTDDKGILCIDLENSTYENITRNVLVKGSRVSNAVYKDSERKFVELIKHVKSKRPNVTVGVYGMPFRALDASRVRKGSESVLDPILSEVDVLFPSLYIPYPSKDQALTFLKLNLDRSFSYAERLNKPVVPFFWYLLFPTDTRKMRHEMIPKQDMLEYIKYVQDYRSPSGKDIEGIIWWDTPTQYTKKLIKQNLLESKDQKKSWTMENQFQYYFGK